MYSNKQNKTLNFQTAEVCIINLPLTTLLSKHILQVKGNATADSSLHILFVQKNFTNFLKRNISLCDNSFLHVLDIKR